MIRCANFPVFFVRHIFGLIFFVVFLSSCEKTTQVNNSIDLMRASQLNRTLGWHYFQQNHLVEAENKLLLAKKQDPKSAEVLLILAYLYQQNQNTALAKNYYQQAWLLEPHNPTVLNNYGAFLCQQAYYDNGLKLLLNAYSIILNFEEAGLQKAAWQTSVDYADKLDLGFSLNNQSLEQNITTCRLLKNNALMNR